MGSLEGAPLFSPALLVTKSPSLVAEYDFFDDLATFELPFEMSAVALNFLIFSLMLKNAAPVEGKRLSVKC